MGKEEEKEEGGRMDGSNVFFYFLIYGRLNGLELEEEEFFLYFS